MPASEDDNSNAYRLVGSIVIVLVVLIVVALVVVLLYRSELGL